MTVGQRRKSPGCDHVCMSSGSLCDWAVGWGAPAAGKAAGGVRWGQLSGLVAA
ncbi:hypothetical protein roselon_03553 [Roseibacterium elongatum DSM 19469]|uniref:Uncharacterized protein n=1 Tax=Roseicyclus elongatus DSM 19469 TaxID=1294273 RepID=W8S9V5_9RHOB|nr:hypothetical protein roselon_03553 [Roseibacterium elongatum DSM 19469]